MQSRESQRFFTQQDDQSRTPFTQTDNQLFTSVKDNYFNALPLFIRSSCFSHVGEDDEAEMDDGQMTFYCPLSAWVGGSSSSKEREKVYEYCLSVFWPDSSRMRTSFRETGW